MLLFDCENQSSLLAELVLQGADGIIDGMGRIRRFGQVHDELVEQRRSPSTYESMDPIDAGPVLTAAELAALLDDLP